MMPVFYHSINSNKYYNEKKGHTDVKTSYHHSCDGYKEIFLSCLSKKINSNDYDRLLQSYTICGDMETKYFQCLMR